VINEVAWLVGVTLMGACVGSFLNVVIHRLPLGAGLGGRSACPQCGKPIPFYLNLPVLGWLALRGRARCCGAKISWRYPLVEALTACAFAVLWLYPPPGAAAAPKLTPDGVSALALLVFALQAFFLSDLIANTFIDIDHRILPDRLTYPGLAVGLVGSVLVPGLAGLFETEGRLSPNANSLMFSLAGALVGGGLTWTVRWLGTIAFKKEAMGLGDVKFMAMIGAFVGWDGSLLTLLLGSAIGALIGTLHLLRSGEAAICFGPFLAVGAAIALFVRAQLIGYFVDDLPQLQQRHPTLTWLMLATAGASLVLLLYVIRRGRRP
jgi:leader peptidase (prepilin peptidase)/N-methyltransferase